MEKRIIFIVRSEIYPSFFIWLNKIVKGELYFKDGLVLSDTLQGKKNTFCSLRYMENNTRISSVFILQLYETWADVIKDGAISVFKQSTKTTNVEKN